MDEKVQSSRLFLSAGLAFVFSAIGIALFTENHDDLALAFAIISVFVTAIGVTLAATGR